MDTSKPGVALIVDRVVAAGNASPREFVDRCLDLCGPLHLSAETRSALVEFAEEQGPLSFDNGVSEDAPARIARMLQLIVAAPEYQFS